MAETAIWPNFFLKNVFFALKGSKSIIFICASVVQIQHKSLMIHFDMANPCKVKVHTSYVGL